MTSTPASPAGEAYALFRKAAFAKTVAPVGKSRPIRRNAPEPLSQPSAGLEAAPADVDVIAGRYGHTIHTVPAAPVQILIDSCQEGKEYLPHTLRDDVQPPFEVALADRPFDIVVLRAGISGSSRGCRQIGRPRERRSQHRRCLCSPACPLWASRRAGTRRKGSKLW